jgi:hypothetical protein
VNSFAFHIGLLVSPHPTGSFHLSKGETASSTGAHYLVLYTLSRALLGSVGNGSSTNDADSGGPELSRTGNHHGKKPNFGYTDPDHALSHRSEDRQI